MSTRELVVLGTSSQVPTRYRNHNGYLLLWDGVGLLFDPGEGTQRQMTLTGTSVSSVHHVLVTHFHGDHCLGLPGIIQRISLDRVPHPVHVHFPASGESFFRRLRRASIFVDYSDLHPNPIDTEGVFTTTPAFNLSARRLSHGVDTFGYRLEEPDSVSMQPDKLNALGITGRDVGTLRRDEALVVDGRIVRLDEVSVPRPGQKFAFIMDTRPCDAAIALARDADLVVIESTFLDEDAALAAEYGHMTATEAATIAREANAKRLVLSHFSQRYPSSKPFVEQARRVFTNAVAASDGDRIAVPKRLR